MIWLSGETAVRGDPLLIEFIYKSWRLKTRTAACKHVLLLLSRYGKWLEILNRITSVYRAKTTGFIIHSFLTMRHGWSN